MATRSNRLDKANLPKLGRRFGRGVKNSDFRPNAPARGSQRGAASGRRTLVLVTAAMQKMSSTLLQISPVTIRSLKSILMY